MSTVFDNAKANVSNIVSAGFAPNINSSTNKALDDLANSIAQREIPGSSETTEGGAHQGNSASNTVQ